MASSRAPAAWGRAGGAGGVGGIPGAPLREEGLAANVIRTSPPSPARFSHIWWVDLGVKSRRIRNGNCPSLRVKRDLSQQLEHVWALAKII